MADPHLTDEQLAALSSSPEAQAHVASCEACAARHEALSARMKLDAPTSEVGAPETARADARLHTLPEGTKIGRYVVVGVAGEGGMGKVYKAFDPELDRKVALKLLHVSRGEAQPGEARSRMLREAQALARLSHPNVVSIYDVGTHEENVFLALELVDGITLREWIKQGGHGWRDILAVFRAAAEGLAAAHDAGLVHRDFKPMNVLIGKDGRVRVLDFGLARAAHSGDPQAARAIHPDTKLSGPGSVSAPGSAAHTPSLASPLTREGAVSGTAGYIAPEVLRGQPADGRGDQFAFGVALFEALFHKKPWSESTVGEYMAAMLQGAQPGIPPDTRVPAWVQQVVLKALEVEPNDRYPSMRELIRALSRDPAAARMRAFAFAGAIGLIALSGFGISGWLRARPDCGAEGRRLAGVWDDTIRGRVQSSFDATGRPAAADTFSRVSHTLDEWSKSWAAEASAACVAEGQAEGAAREAVLLRRVCLERRLGEAKALADLFQSADPGIVDQATNAARVLVAPQRCREPRLITGAALPISDPKARLAADALHGRLDRANAQFVSGQFPLAVKAAGEIAKEAHDQQLTGLEAEALNLLGKIQGRSYQLTEAAQTLEQALAAAERADAEIETFSAAVRLSHVSNMAKKLDDSNRAIAIAERERAKLGDDELLEADLLESRAGNVALQQHFDEALKLRRRVFELKSRRLGQDHPETVAALMNVSKTLGDLGELHESVEAMRRALTISEQSLGKDHPAMIVARCNLCYFYTAEARFEEGAELCEAGAALATRIHGEKNPMSGWCLGNLANLHAAEGDGAAAVDAAARAMTIVEKIFSGDDLELAEARMYQARALMVAGRAAEARVVIDLSLKAAEKVMGRDDPGLAEYLNVKGQTELAAGEAKAALAPLEAARTIREAHGYNSDRADTHFALARALWDSGGDRARARTLAQQAVTELSGFPRHDALRARIEKWLAEHLG